jgi:DNA repair ATPase RecN
MPRYLVFALTSALFCCGCADDADPPAEAPKVAPQNKDISFDDVTRKLGEAAETTGRFLSQKKDEYLPKIKSEVEELDQDLEALNERSAELSEEAREKLKKTLPVLQEKRKELQEQMEKAMKDNDVSWEQVGERIDKAWRELKSEKEQLERDLRDDEQP